MRPLKQIAMRVQRYHPALDAGHVLTARVSRLRPVDVHIRQGLIDSACGHAAVGMALIILGVVKRSAIMDQSRRKYGHAAALWRALSDSWFTGLHVGELFVVLTRLDLPVVLAARDGFDRGVDGFVVDALMHCDLALVAYESVRDRQHRHWVLCVGVGALEVGSTLIVDSLLSLDSSCDPLPFACHNARFQLSKPVDFARRKKSVEWRYETTPQYAETVRLMGAISIRPKDDMPNRVRNG